MSPLIPGEQRQSFLLDGEPLEDVEKFNYLGSMFVANGHGTEELINRINLARSAIPSLVAACNIVACKGQGLSGSSALDCALRLRDMACTSSRRKDVGGL